MTADGPADRRPDKPGRRAFLRGAVLGAGAAAVGAPTAAPAAEPGERPRSVPPVVEASGERSPPPPHAGGAQLPCGSDYMLDVVRSLGIDHVAFIPGNTFKGLHESIINYGMLTAPRMELVSTMHEETSIAVAHGFAKVEGRPMACLLHSTVGLQHAAMAIYNAWADRVPVFAMVGAQLDATRRHDFVDWVHSVFDGPALVRDFIKWDDTPVSLAHFGESAVQACKFAMTPPYGPVLLAVDQNLQEEGVAGALPRIPRLPAIAPPSADAGTVEEIARRLVAAENPVLLVDRCARTPAGLLHLIELAELLRAAVVDGGARMNFPWRHPLNQTSRQNAALAQADVVLALEVTDVYGSTVGIVGPQAAVVSISSNDMYMKSNYQDFQRLSSAQVAAAADAEASLPALIEAVQRQLRSRTQSTRQARGAKLAELHQAALAGSRNAAALGWDDRPISTARMCMEVYEQIRNEDWALVSGTIFQNMWPQQLWNAEHHHQYIGDAGAYGLGYLPGASVGAALAHRRHGRLAVAIGGDGDLMFSPGALWTAAHQRVPLLYVVHNNRAYHQEVMYVQAMANRRGRGIDRAHVGNVIRDPEVSFGALARSMGVYAEGPIIEPADLGPALQRALVVVKRGEPALVDVVAQGR
jgi:thiamine pyrophosphate-dependent acetolactate synthase large subunit-like protein